MALKQDNPLLAYVFQHFAKYQAVVETDEDGFTYLINSWYPMGFAHWYEDIVKSIPFKREDYDKHKPLQELLTELDLSYIISSRKSRFQKKDQLFLCSPLIFILTD